VAGEQDGNRRAAGHRGAGRHRCADRLVGRAQAVGVVDADHPDTGHRAGEGDHAGAGRQHHLAGLPGQVHAAVPGQPRLRRRLEGPGHHRRARQRPAVGADSGTGRARHRRTEQDRRRQQREQQQEQHSSGHAGQLRGSMTARQSRSRQSVHDGRTCGPPDDQRNDLLPPARIRETTDGLSGNRPLSVLDRAAHDGSMRNLLLAIVGVVVVGVVAWWLIKVLLGLFFYLVVGALVVGGGIYLYHRAKRSLTSGRTRQIRR
jgi:hypothetical protein